MGHTVQNIFYYKIYITIQILHVLIKWTCIYHRENNVTVQRMMTVYA